MNPFRLLLTIFAPETQYAIADTGVLASCRPLEAQLANMECNSTSAVQITHHFLRKMVRAMSTLERQTHQWHVWLQKQYF